jgi:adenylate cyclase class IV
MYTQVTFGQFLEKLFSKTKAERGIEFDEYPNLAVSHRDGDWLHQIDNRLGVRVFRWPLHENKDEMVKGPDWDNLQETREEFETRFENDFSQALNHLGS